MSAIGDGMRLSELLQGWVETAPELRVRDLCLDSRQCQAGSLFIARSGSREHGWSHVDDALARGAVAVLHDGDAEVPEALPVPAVELEDLNDRLPELAARFWGCPNDMDLIAVTGTNGKTSVAWLLAQALNGMMMGTLGLGRPGEQVAGTLTTPDVLSVYRGLAEARAAGTATVVLEASSHALAQHRLAGLRFASVIFTGLGHDHLDYHHDLTRYFEAKARLFTDFQIERCIINFDDEHGRELAARVAGRASVLGFSLKDAPTAAARVEALALNLSGTQARLRRPSDTIELNSRLIGRTNLNNLAIVALELAARGVEGHDIASRVAALEPVPGRLQTVCDARGLCAVIDYAHTPDAIERLLISLRELGPDRLICVFGCGGDRDASKRPLMGRVAEALADRVILTDDNPRSEDGTAIIRAIQSGMRHPERSRVIRDRAAAIRTALAEARPGDLVVVAGKGHEREQWIGEQCLPHSDEAVIRDALEVAA